MRLPVFPVSALRDPDHRRVVIYAFSSGLAAILTLVLTRVLWHTLTRADFGLWSLIDPMLLPAASLILFGVENAIVKQLRIDGRPLREITGTLLASTVPLTCVCLLIIGVVARFVFHLVWTDALLLTLAGEALILMMQTAYRSAGAVNGFAALLLSRNILYLLALLAAWAFHGGEALPVSVVFLIRGASVIVISLVALAILRPVLRVNRQRYVDALRYGSPLLLASFIFAVNDMTDRWFLAEYSGVMAVGIYALHLKLAAILAQAVVIPFGLWFPAERFKRLGTQGDGAAFFVGTASILAVVCTFLSGAVWLSRDILLGLIAPGAAASPLILGCCLAAVISLALSQALNVGLLLPGQTLKNAICSFCAVIGTALCAAVLVRFIGADGAAESRLFGAVLMTSVTAILSYRVCRVEFPFVGMVMYFVASAAALIGINYALAIDPSGRMAGGGADLFPLITALLLWSGITIVFATLFLGRLRGIKLSLPLRPAPPAREEAV